MIPSTATAAGWTSQTCSAFWIYIFISQSGAARADMRTSRHDGFGIELREARLARPGTQAPHEAPLGVGADRPRCPVHGVLCHRVGRLSSI